MYHDIFVTEFNIGFGFPHSDTCDTCDSKRLAIKQAPTQTEKDALQHELDEHLSQAQSGYTAFLEDQERCKLSYEKFNEQNA